MGEPSARSTEPLAFSCQGRGRRELRATYLRGKWGHLLLTVLSHSLSLHQAMQEKKALSSRGRGRLRGFLELRRPWGFSPEAREAP